MDSRHLEQSEKSSPETSSDSSVYSDSPDKIDPFGDHLVHPRVGDDYQVEIPPMLQESEFLHLMTNPTDSLHIPVKWIYNDANPVKDEKIKSLNTPRYAPNQLSLSTGCCLVPDLLNAPLTEFEADCFLLGLYIFGKNLLQVKRFMESKDMGQILSFYYGRFYQSDGYRRWSECRKMRNKKCLIGHRFFTGCRQQELFSRLLPRLSEESKTKLLEAYREFTEGKTLLDEYVSTLKALVGIQALVEAIGIGKGKEDLTTLIMENSKNIQSSKDFTSLTCSEIVEYLTGDIRLSKARSNDLFWEAIWPRLLARGWHSEQPTGVDYNGSKTCLVFLIPGINKFSRRKLTKGDHYFDSISDVLKKVASEPELLELESCETKPSSLKEENRQSLKVNSGDNHDHDQDRSDRVQHNYLKPRISKGLSKNPMKFTVVDTSLANKVRELRCLPLEAKKSSAQLKRLKKTGEDIVGNSDILENGVRSSTFSASDIPDDANLSDYRKSRHIKHQFSRRIKPSPSSCTDSNTKRRRLASCLEADVTYVLSLPATNKNTVSRAPRKKLVLSKTSSVESTPNEENEKKPGLTKVIDLNLPPQVPSERESDGEKPKPRVVGLSDTKESLVSCASLGDKNGGSDEMPRRQSTRNRPLTTKALEALEIIGFLNPVRHSRKRSPSKTRDQNSKRSRQLHKSSVLVSPPIETTPTEKEVVASGSI